MHHSFATLLDVLSVRIGFLAKRHWTVNPEVSVKKGTRGQPHPVTSVQTPIMIKKKLFKHLGGTRNRQKAS